MSQRILPRCTTVVGGAASGKSLFAEDLIRRYGTRPLYLATAQVWDEEMSRKVAAHRAQRGDDWDTIEEPLAIAALIDRQSGDQPLLLDCATLWLSNVLLAEQEIAPACDALLAALAAYQGPVVVVTNEVGQGIVPDNALARRFRNAQGKLNQRLAAQSDLVVTVIAGLPLALKGRLP